ncbi:MAG: hypothetical protein JXQ76_04935 [Campylobacterales bacterium]|nr:hypothetical protein [Campylobacterales bacterium]
MRSIKYVTPLTSRTFVNKQMSVKCNDEANNMANTPTNHNKIATIRKEWNDMEYRPRKTKKINFIINEK